MKKKGMKYCKCGCGRKAGKGRSISETCKNRIWRKNNPIGHLFKNLRGSAKKRKKEFSITLEYFKELCLNTGYHEGTGRGGDCLTIDRIRNLEGYVVGNIAVIKRCENSSKGVLDLDVEELKKFGIYIEVVGGNAFLNNNYPF